MAQTTNPLKKHFRQIRRQVIRWWRIGAVIPYLLRYNKYTGFISRRLFQYLPIILPHDQSYYGFTHLVHEGDGLFLDVGANDGISAIGFRHIHSDYRILSIEPNLCNEYSLRKLKNGKLTRFDYLLIGAGSQRSQTTLYIPVYNSVPIYTAASSNKDFALRSMHKHRVPNDKNKSIAILEYKVDIVPLDELNLKPDIIKIDTEGFDYEVLLGLVETIKAYRPPILFEYNPDLIDDLMKFFLDRDYRLLTYHPDTDRFYTFNRRQRSISRHMKYVANNVFCVPREKFTDIPMGDGRAG